MEDVTRSRIFDEGIPARNAQFTGRDEQLRLLREGLRASSVEVLGQPPQAVFGLGGVGKTEIAAEYAYRYAEDYDIVWWVHSEQEARVQDAFVKLAKRLGIAHAETQRDKSIWAVLAELRTGRYHRWLLIFDNAAEPEVIKRYVPTGRPHGHVIITSRKRNWRRHTKAEGIEVSQFSEQETVELLRKRVPHLAPRTELGEPLDPEADRARHADASSLARALGNLPIAAEHAAAYLAETGAPVGSYLRMFEENAHTLLSKQVDMDYPYAVAATWTISSGQLGEDAVELFNLFAFFSPEPMAEELFLTGGGRVRAPAALAEVLGDADRFREAVRQLHSYSLAKSDGHRGVVEVHRVVQAVTLGQARIERPQDCADYTAAAHTLLAATNPRNPDLESNDARYDLSRPHLWPAGALDTENPDLRQLVIDQVRRLHLRGGHEEALRLGQEARQAWRAKWGHDDEKVLQLSVEVGNALRVAGRYTEMQALNAETLERLTRTLGAEHQTTLMCANSYGGDLRSLGRFTEALELDLTILPQFERVFRPDHPRTLNVRNNLGADYRRLGRFHEAWEQDQLTYEMRARALGPTDLRTIRSKDSISVDLRGCGEYHRSLEAAQDVIAVLKERKGGESLDSLNAHKSYAVALRKVGRYDEALAESEQVLRRYAAFLGAEHRYTLRASINRINDLRVTDRLREAEALGRWALRLCAEVDIPKGDITWAATVNLALVLRGLNRPEEARALDEAALRGMTDLFGAKHPLTLQATANLVSDLALVGDTAKARELGEDLYEASRISLGENHPDTLAIGANLSLDRRATLDPAQADELRTDIMSRYEQVLTSKHPVVRIAEQRGRVNVDIEPY
ncbi:FxSxx-COOH system tetratricopeptide repeat protein [Streptomyces sp. NBC_01190]|uniref:FxSxx-COOH system tetratricopeptide repeat protein n=1 Tax=Streptomyces sp. NBC_01190 TaxID=2903767 RepID=UPI00386F3E32|nr:FxSxx-COOH system tetratricopeptide repeat protein [Streptomyces sp. NBC_01190]